MASHEQIARSDEAFDTLIAQIVSLSAKLAAAEGERDRQYDENVNRIAAQASAEACADRLERQNRRMMEGLHRVQQWARAYPLKVFPEPDFEKARALLEAGGLTLDAISASNMRHVVNEVAAIADAALTETEGKADV